MEETLKELYEKICAGDEVRKNLIEMKARLKQEEDAAAFFESGEGNADAIMKCLVDADPKARKNAAEILGMLNVPGAVDVLVDAWEAEETLYVRPAYVKALSGKDCEQYLDVFHERLAALQSYDAPPDEQKHVREEIGALEELILSKEGVKKHKFTGYHRANEVILKTLPAFRGILADEMPFQKTMTEDGLALSVGEMNLVTECRYWQEMLFVLHPGGQLPGEAEEIAAGLKRSDLMEILTENHSGQAPFVFRIGVTGYAPREERALLARQAAQAVSEAFRGELINSPSRYEVEIRLHKERGGGLTPYLKMFTIPDRRFSYRRYHVSAGMKPYVAAGLVGLAKPYLTDHAQILDPFCGVGTLLIERRFAGPVRSAYGIDTFGEAIEKARRNAQIAGMPVNYINRDFFDFTHDYLFDEILTDLPDPVGDRAETDAFYGAFLEKSAELLSERGRIFCYTAQTGLLKKHLRLNGRFRLIAQFPILEQSGTALFVLERRNERGEKGQ